jgi:hypothetical protein
MRTLLRWLSTALAIGAIAVLSGVFSPTQALAAASLPGQAAAGPTQAWCATNYYGQCMTNYGSYGNYGNYGNSYYGNSYMNRGRGFDRDDFYGYRNSYSNYGNSYMYRNPYSNYGNSNMYRNPYSSYGNSYMYR